MNIIFANDRPALPFFFDGGAERTTSTLIAGLARKGIKLTQISTFPRGSIDLAEATANSLASPYVKRDTLDDSSDIKTKHLVVSQGLLKILAISSPEFETVCRQIMRESKPDLLITWLNGSSLVIRLGDEFNIPTVLRVVGPDGSQGYPPLGSKTIVLANSPLTAQICSARYCRHVNFLLGIINHADYVSEPRMPDFVTYINPRKEKGIHLFCKVAALLPEIPFLVVLGWSRTNYQKDELQAIEFLKSLPNVTLKPSVADMRQVYSVTSILVLPSRWPESWARVIGEAQASGIPVIASNRGCSPQSVGLGGIILDYKDPNMWAGAIKLLYKDDALRSDLGNKAKLNINRFQPDALLKNYEHFFSAVSEGKQIQQQPETDAVEIFRGYRDCRGKLKLELKQIPMGMNFDISDPVYP